MERKQLTKEQKAKRLHEAMEYLNYCEHEGEDVMGEIYGMTDEEIIDYADSLSDRGEAAYDAWKERGT
jgi:hypothetical protein